LANGAACVFYEPKGVYPGRGGARPDAFTRPSSRYRQGGKDPVVSVAQFNARVAPPGTRWHYASAETEILGLILRAATGKPVANYLSEKDLAADWHGRPTTRTGPRGHSAFVHPNLTALVHFPVSSATKLLNLTAGNGVALKSAAGRMSVTIHEKIALPSMSGDPTFDPVRWNVWEIYHGSWDQQGTAVRHPLDLRHDLRGLRPRRPLFAAHEFLQSAVNDYAGRYYEGYITRDDSILKYTDPDLYSALNNGPTVPNCMRQNGRVVQILSKSMLSIKAAAGAAFAGRGRWARSNFPGMTRAYPPAWFTGRMVSLATRWDELNHHVQASGQLVLPF
jgi:hypothetical protein